MLHPRPPTRLLLALLSGLVSAGAWAAAPPRLAPVAADRPIPVEDFFRAPLISDPRLNGDGTMLAALATLDGNRRCIIVTELAEGKQHRVEAEAPHDICSFEWLTSRRLMFRVQVENRYAAGVFVANIRSIDRIDQYSVETGSVTRTIGVPRASPDHPIVWFQPSAKRSGRDGILARIDTSLGIRVDQDEVPWARGSRADRADSRYGVRANILEAFPAPKEGPPIDYLAGADGEPAYALTAISGVSVLHQFVAGVWRRTPVDMNRLHIVGLGDRPGELLVKTAGPGEAPPALCRFDVAANTLGARLFQDEKYDFDTAVVYRHPGDHRIVGYGLDRARWQNTWLDPAYSEVQAIVGQQLPNHCMKLLGVDGAATRFLCCIWSDRQPASYVLVDRSTGRLDPAGSSRPWIDPARMCAGNLFRFTTRDERRQEGYLTLPAGASRVNPVPLVVYPHGGPWQRDSWQWDPVVQFLASCGYAVFQPNYRGSSSYSWQRPAEDLWAFRKMHDDVTDGVAALKRTGLVDAGRIAIMGSSFGGYLALCGAAFESGTYRCAVSIAGVFDWARMVAEARRLDEDSARAARLMHNLGDPADGREQFDAISPINHLDGVRVPIFVAHGTADRVVDVGQSKRLVRELQRRNIPCTALFVSGETHRMSSVDNRVLLYKAIERFLAANLGPLPGSLSPAPGPSK